MEGDTSGLLSVPDGDMATPDRADPGAQQQAAMPATTSPKAPAPLLPADLSPDAGFATPAPVPMAPAPVHNVHVRCEVRCLPAASHSVMRSRSPCRLSAHTPFLLQACKSLLEVGVPMTQVMMGDPIVVRCGSCTTLLRVALRPTAPAPPPPHMESAFMTQLRMQAAAAAQHQHKLRMMAMYGQMGMMPPTPHSMGQHPPRPEAMYLPSPMNSFGRGFGGMMQPPMMASLSPGVAPGVGHHPGAWMFPPRGVGGGAVGGGGSPDVQRMKVTREPSAYNLHMRDELRRLKSDQPGIEHREAWKMASGSVRAWALFEAASVNQLRAEAGILCFAPAVEEGGQPAGGCSHGDGAAADI